MSENVRLPPQQPDVDSETAVTPAATADLQNARRCTRGSRFFFYGPLVTLPAHLHKGYPLAGQQRLEHGRSVLFRRFVIEIVSRKRSGLSLSLSPAPSKLLPLTMVPNHKESDSLIADYTIKDGEWKPANERSSDILVESPVATRRLENPIYGLVDFRAALNSEARAH